MDLQDRLRDELRRAMRARDRGVVDALRVALGDVGNAEAVAVAEEPGARSAAPMGQRGLGAAEAERRPLTDEEVRGIVEARAAELAATAATYRAHGRDDAADELDAVVAVLRSCTDGGPPAAG